MVKQEFRSVIVILLLACGLRFAGITFDSLWLDEGYQSMADAHGQALPDFLHPDSAPYLFKFSKPGSLEDTLATFRKIDPLCPPLYAVLLNRWMSLFGQSDLAVRSLSALLSILSVGSIYAIGRIFIGHKPALMAMVFQAVSPFDIHYAQEARMYALEILCAGLSCGSLYWILSGPARGRLAAGLLYSVSSWAVINSHYTGLFMMLFQGVFSIATVLKRRDWRLLLTLCLCWGGVFVLWLPWFDIFRHASSNRTASFYVARAPGWVWPLTALFFRIPLNWISFLSGNRVTLFAIPIYGTAVILLLCGALSLGANTRWISRFRGEVDWTDCSRKMLPFLWCWAVLPALFLWLIDVIENHRVVEISRYTVASSPAVYLLAGTGAVIFLAPSMVRRMIILLHILLALVNNAFAHVVHQREPWKEMASSVESLCSPEDVLLVAQYYDIVCLDRYLNRPIKQIGIGSNLNQQQIADVIGNLNRFWLLTAQEGESAAANMPAEFKITKRVDYSHGLHLRLYEK